MRAFVERHRHVSLLVAVLLAQLFFLAFQIKGQNDVRLIRLWAMAVVAPVEKLANGVVDGVASLYSSYIGLYHAREESQRLEAELAQARLRVQELETQAAEAEQLHALLGLKQAHPRAPLVAAEVIGSSPAAATLTVLINRGSEAGLAPNMVVLTPEGVVGKIIAAYPGSAEVLLLTDRKSGVGAMVADTRLLGVLKGAGGYYCRLEYVPNEETVAVGAELVTSGQDQVFPKGLPLGRVVAVRPGELFQEITVEPAAALRRLESVLVLAGAPQALTTTAEAGPAPAR